jgi:hypothetical protein
MPIKIGWPESAINDLPHGVVGMMAQRQFDEVEEAAPGILAKME